MCVCVCVRCKRIRHFVDSSLQNKYLDYFASRTLTSRYGLTCIARDTVGHSIPGIFESDYPNLLTWSPHPELPGDGILMVSMRFAAALSCFDTLENTSVWPLPIKYIAYNTVLHSPQKKVVNKIVEKNGKNLFLNKKVVKIYHFFEEKIRAPSAREIWFKQCFLLYTLFSMF